MQVCEWVTCRFSLYCHSGISKKKTKSTKIPSTTTKYASVSISFMWLLYSSSSQMGCSQTFLKNAKAPQQIQFTLLPTHTGQAGTNWGSLSVAIVQVLWRKHGVSSSPRLAGISRWLNMRWSEAEWKNSLSGFDLYHKSESLSNTVLPCESRGLAGIAKGHYAFSPTADLRTKRKTVCLQPPAWEQCDKFLPICSS